MAFKAVEMVRRIRDENYEKTKDLSVEEQLQLTHEKAARFLASLAKGKKPVVKNSTPTTPRKSRQQA